MSRSTLPSSEMPHSLRGRLLWSLLAAIVLTALAQGVAAYRTARSEDEALLHAREIGYPLVVRPSYVLGGRAMEVVHAEADHRPAVVVSGHN